jgi:glycerophosphoryl diester phosphodiesterase
MVCRAFLVTKFKKGREVTLVRPFYVLAHNPNSLEAARAALDVGANAIEPDVNVYAARPDVLCIGEPSLLGGGNDPAAPSLSEYLTGLHQLALERPELALVVFDCKPKAATLELGATLLQTIRSLLTFDTDLNVVISVASLSHTSIFEQIRHDLRLREALMIDQENDPVRVATFFTNAGVERHCYGNGISFLNSLLGPNVRPSLERACELRAATGAPRFTYAWTVDAARLMREYIRIGVDGIITNNVGRLRAVSAEPEFQSTIRRATRADDPFAGPRRAYGLIVHTGDKWMAGTDARVTFILTGAAGSAGVTVDTRRRARMERNAWNYVTLETGDLGPLHAITVQHDNQGNAPGWYLDRIVVESACYGVSLGAGFACWIDQGVPVTRPLT